MSPSAWAVCRAAAWSRSTAPSPPVRPPSPSTPSPPRRPPAASWPSSPHRTRSTPHLTTPSPATPTPPAPPRTPPAQAAGVIVAFIDAEHALDPDYAKNLGVDTDALLVSQPDSGEQALEIADMLIRSGALDLIVIDSVAALVPRAEVEGEMGDSHVGLQARLMSQALRKMTGALNNSGTTAIFINQLREKIGVMLGSPEPTPGDRALKFYSSVDRTSVGAGRSVYVRLDLGGRGINKKKRTKTKDV